MSRNNEDMEPKEGRFVRFGLSMDSWLISYAIDNEFKSVPELVRHIAREFKQAQAYTSGRSMKLVSGKSE